MSAASAVSPIRVGQGGERSPAASHAHANAIASRIRSQGSACIRVLTGSMSPWIRSGDQVFVRRWEINQIMAGDVVLFERSEKFFVHRVLRRVRAANGESLLITKGDALDSQDEFISAAEFLGRATRIHRKNRHIDIESLGQTILGRILARVSSFSIVLYAPIRLVARLFG